MSFKRTYRLFILLLIILLCLSLGSMLFIKRNAHFVDSVPKLSLVNIEPMPKLQVGDVILRMGVGLDSVVIAQISASKFSHVGIISQIEPQIMVTHATTDDDAGSNFNGVIDIKLENFVSQSERLAIVRYKQLSAESKIKIKAYLKAQEGKPFSLENNSDALYCSNLVLTALKDKVELNIKADFIDMPLFKGFYYMPQAFLDDPNGTLIYYYPKD